jgi:hypothetical protein
LWHYPNYYDKISEFKLSACFNKNEFPIYNTTRVKVVQIVNFWQSLLCGINQAESRDVLIIVPHRKSVIFYYFTGFSGITPRISPGPVGKGWSLKIYSLFVEYKKGALYF